MSISQWLERAWYSANGQSLRALRPLECLYRCIVKRRARTRRYGMRTPLPVIVVGNLNVGGTGKSPLVAWLARFLVEQGWQPGIVSRGYGGKATAYPVRVTADSSPAMVGDEPVMLARQTGVPVAVSPKRPDAVDMLHAEGCNIIISDDGLQHYALARDIELVVVDGTRGFGNRHCLPCGPLREPLDRLASVDAVLVNGRADTLGELQVREPSLPADSFEMALRPCRFRQLTTGETVSTDNGLFLTEVHAIAGIGHPERFFHTLQRLNVKVVAHPFADHHAFVASDLQFHDGRPVVMTAKDAVKCAAFATERCWALEVEAEPTEAFVLFLQQRLAALATHCRGSTPR